MVQKIPPPPLVTTPELQSLNRWLLEIQSILDAAGGIDPAQIPGYDGLAETVAAQGVDITDLQGSVASIATQLADLTARVTAAESSITSLAARNQVYNGTAAPAGALGVDGDWFYNRSGAAGARLYIKVAGSWSAQAI